jgi:hypothetical protein
MCSGISFYIRLGGFSIYVEFLVSKVSWIFCFDADNMISSNEREMERNYFLLSFTEQCVKYILSRKQKRNKGADCPDRCNQQRIRDILHSHGGEYKDDCLLGCCAA